MAKATIGLLFLLSVIAALLIGVNIGKKSSKVEIIPTPTVIPSHTPTLTPLMIHTNPSAKDIQITQNGTISTLIDKSCGFTLTFPSSYTADTTNGRSAILTNSTSGETIITACESEIPKPPLPGEKIISVIVDEVPGNVYHDQDSRDGKPRDELIIKHPTNKKEIIIAGFGTEFNTTLSTLKFLR